MPNKRKSTTDTTDKELTYTVTEKECQAGLAKGWTDDDMLKPGKYKVRHSRFVAKPRELKVKISLYLDGDVLEHFKTRAAAPHAAPYQTQINNELRRVMENSPPENGNLKDEILNNEVFCGL